MTQLEKSPNQFTNLPLIADVEYSEDDECILPCNHTVTDFCQAIQMVKLNNEIYGNSAAAMAMYINKDSLRDLWQEYVDQEVYYRPDYLAALVAVSMEEILNEIGQELKYYTFRLNPVVGSLEIQPASLWDRRDKIKHQAIVWSIPEVACT